VALQNNSCKGCYVTTRYRLPEPSSRVNDIMILIEQCQYLRACW